MDRTQCAPVTKCLETECLPMSNGPGLSRYDGLLPAIFAEVQRQNSCRTRNISQKSVNTEFQEAPSLMAGASTSFSIAGQFISIRPSFLAIVTAAITAAPTLDPSMAGTSRMWSSPSADSPRISLKASITRSGNCGYLEKTEPSTATWHCCILRFLRRAAMPQAYNLTERRLINRATQRQR